VLGVFGGGGIFFKNYKIGQIETATFDWENKQ